MRDPSAVVTVADLALLVGAQFLYRRFVCRGVVADRDLRRHPAHRMDLAAVAGLDQELAVAAQEMRGHCDLPAIGHHAIRVLGEFLNEAEDVIPAAAIEAGRMVAQFPEDLVHLEGGHDRFDQHGRADRPFGQAEPRLRMQEDAVP